jgi:hypothetical protein
VTRARWDERDFVVAVGCVDLLVKLALDGGASPAIAIAHAAVVFSGFRIDEPIAADALWKMPKLSAGHDKRDGLTYPADTRDAHVIAANLASRSILDVLECLNEGVGAVSAVEFAWLVSVPVGQPCVVLFSNRHGVLFAALLCSEARRILGTRIDVADLVASSFTDAKLAVMSWRWMVTLAGLYRHTGTARSRARAPIGPVAPASIDWRRKVLDAHALLILAPLVLSAHCSRCSGSQEGCACAADRAPQLRANLVESRAHFYVLIRDVELQTTLKVCIVHGTGWKVWILVL